MIGANAALRVVVVHRRVYSLVYIQIMLQQRDNVQETLGVNQGGYNTPRVILQI